MKRDLEQETGGSPVSAEVDRRVAVTKQLLEMRAELERLLARVDAFIGRIGRDLPAAGGAS